MSTPAPTMFVFGAGENLIEEMEENMDVILSDINSEEEAQVEEEAPVIENLP